MRTLHVGLRVQDLERSRDFYASLGYEVIGTVQESPMGSLTMLKLPEDDYVSVELVHDPARGPVNPGGFNHLVIQTEDLRETIGRLAAQGIQVDTPASPDGSEDFLTTWLTDPDGYRIEMVQWPPGHAVGMTRADFPEGSPEQP
ncbi:VOC family protein [Jatrophihabitans sp.]|uniref:VOC family protein n=1 Tax=Jatrophihabitans sp. TaxID=1932789 RepID=UPI002EE63FB7